MKNRFQNLPFKLNLQRYNAGDTTSMCNLAMACGRGDGVALDSAEALRWLAAAEAGGLDPQRVLACRANLGR